MADSIAIALWKAGKITAEQCAQALAKSRADLAWYVRSTQPKPKRRGRFKR